MWASIRPPVSLSGLENLSETGPYLVVANHLNGPGMWVGFAAALINAVVGRASPNLVIHTVGVAAYRDFRLFGRIPVPDSFTASIFARF